jgi:hypothetical protein
MIMREFLGHWDSRGLFEKFLLSLTIGFCAALFVGEYDREIS